MAVLQQICDHHVGDCSGFYDTGMLLKGSVTSSPLCLLPGKQAGSHDHLISKTFSTCLRSVLRTTSTSWELFAQNLRQQRKNAANRDEFSSNNSHPSAKTSKPKKAKVPHQHMDPTRQDFCLIGPKSQAPDIHSCHSPEKTYNYTDQATLSTRAHVSYCQLSLYTGL